MVLGYHVIFGAYGFWLPNDPRGSWSDFVRSWELYQYGRATKTDSRRSLAHRPHNRQARLRAKDALKYPPVRCSGVQARAIGRGFATFVDKSGLVVWACSILPQHVHLVTARHRYHVEQVVNLLKGQATRQLIREGIHPLAPLVSPSALTPKVFARGLWKVFLDSEESLRRAIRYVQSNPMKEGKPAQNWSFLTPFAERRSPRKRV